MRAAEFSFEELDAEVQAINKLFGTSISLSTDVYEELQQGLRVVSGAVEDTDPVTRKDFETRLEQLRSALATTIGLLAPARGGLWLRADSEFALFIAEVVGERSLLETHLRLLEALQSHCDRAAARLAETPAKRGRRSLEFYEAFMRLVLPIAERLGIKVTTAGDRVDNPYSTPFTQFVYALEQFLPRAAWSNSLTACAKRIDRALKDLGVPRQN